MQEGGAITTIEGIGPDGELDPLQAAFVERDALQCGYCTPGQICSAPGMLGEVAAGWPSAISRDLAARPSLDDERNKRADEREHVPVRAPTSTSSTPSCDIARSGFMRPLEIPRGTGSGGRSGAGGGADAEAAVHGRRHQPGGPDEAGSEPTPPCWWTSAGCRWTKIEPTARRRAAASGPGCETATCAADPRVRDKLRGAVAGAAGRGLRSAAEHGHGRRQPAAADRCLYFQDVTKACNKRVPGSGCPARDGDAPEPGYSGRLSCTVWPPTRPTWRWRWLRWTRWCISKECQGRAVYRLLSCICGLGTRLTWRRRSFMAT